MAQIKTNLQYGVTGSLQTANVANDAIGLAQMASGTDGNVITYDASGNPAVVSTGSSGHFLKSQGAGSVPVFAAATIPDGTPYFAATRNHGSGNQTIATSTDTVIVFATETADSDNGFDPSTGFYTVPSGKGGKYWVMVMQEYTTANFTAALAIEIAGSKVVESYQEGISGVYPPYSNPLVWVGDVAAGATIKAKTTQSSGGNADLQKGGTQIHFMGIRIA